MPRLSRDDLLHPTLPTLYTDLVTRAYDLRKRCEAAMEAKPIAPETRARLDEDERNLRRDARAAIPSPHGLVTHHDAVLAFVAGVRLLEHYERTVHADGEVVDTYGSATLDAFETDWAPCPGGTERVHRALQAAFQLSDDDHRIIEAFVQPEITALERRHRLVEAIDRHYALHARTDVDHAVHELFSDLYQGQPLQPGEVQIVRTCTSLFFIVPEKATCFDRSAPEIQPFLDRLHAFHHGQLGHFPVFGCYRGEGSARSLLDHLQRETQLPREAIVETLTTMVSVLPRADVDKYLWHDAWGHQWQSHLLPFEHDFRAIAEFDFPPHPQLLLHMPDGRQTSLAELAGEAVRRLHDGQDLDGHWDVWLDALMKERLSLVGSGLIAECLADVMEFKLFLLAPDRAAALPSSSAFKDRPTKLDLMVKDVGIFQRMGQHGMRRFVEEDEALEDALEALSEALPVAPTATLRRVILDLREQVSARLEHRFATRPLVGDAEPSGEVTVNVNARLLLNQLCLAATLDETYRRNAAKPISWTAPITGFLDILVLSTGAYFQMDPMHRLWHLDEYLALHFGDCLETFARALTAETDTAAS